MNDLLKMPKTPKGVETLNNILSAAAQIIYEKGYHKANIGEITKLAGVATGTFYVYFDSKISLYKYLLLQFGHSIRRELAEKTKDCASRREVEREGFRAWLEYVRKHPYVYNIIWESLYIDRNLFTEYYETFNEAYKRGLKSAEDGGEISDIDKDVLSYALMGISNFIGLKYCIFEKSNVDLGKIADELMKLLDNGVFTGYVPERVQKSERRNKELDFRVEVDFDFLGKEKNPED